MDKPIKVKLRPDPDRRGALLLGGISLCEEASTWLRSEFPKGGTFLAAWEKCPDSEWLGYVAYALQRRTGNVSAPCHCQSCMGVWSADRYRAAVPYERIETMLREYMRGRPEVIE